MQTPFHPRKSGPGRRGWETEDSFELRQKRAHKAGKPFGNSGDKLRRKMIAKTLTKKA